VCQSSPYVESNIILLISAKIAKKLKIEPKIKNNDQNECKYELISTFTFTIITRAPNIKLPSRVKPPIYPNYSCALSSVIKLIAISRIPYQKA